MGLQVYYFSTLIYFHTISRRAAKALVRLGGCTVSPEPSPTTCAIGTQNLKCWNKHCLCVEI